MNLGPIYCPGCTKTAPYVKVNKSTVKCKDCGYKMRIRIKDGS